jgi:UTP--glucose-1-phosphate uridylyltransferase
MTDFEQQFAPFAELMGAHDLPDLFIETFAGYYRQLIDGRTGFIAEAEIEPVDSVVEMAGLAERLRLVGEAALPQTVMIKLNGGLGTSMGLERAKSLLVVKHGLSFLDIIAEQAVVAGVPLVLMNSFATEEDSLAALANHPNLRQDLPLSFLQHAEPKVRCADFTPAEWPDDPELAWCPPGHGDIYTALVTRGMLEAMLAQGYRYAFVSNADNLGAVLDPLLLGHLVVNRLPFMMEVAQRTPADRKGGHLARRREDGRLILRESAQCTVEDEPSFQDIQRYRYFNTNNLWIDLEALQQALHERDYKMGLPMIRNEKTVDPRDEESTPVYQLETAMGAAIEVFEGAAAVCVPRSRFAPVKQTNDLLVVRSDVYWLTPDFRLEMNPDRVGDAPDVALDSRFYKFVSDLDLRFADPAPSLLACERLEVQGDVRFGHDVICRGVVMFTNEDEQPQFIPDGAILGSRGEE